MFLRIFDVLRHSPLIFDIKEWRWMKVIILEKYLKTVFDVIVQKWD